MKQIRHEVFVAPPRKMTRPPPTSSTRIVGIVPQQLLNPVMEPAGQHDTRVQLTERPAGSVPIVILSEKEDDISTLGGGGTIPTTRAVLAQYYSHHQKYLHPKYHSGHRPSTSSNRCCMACLGKRTDLEILLICIIVASVIALIVLMVVMLVSGNRQ
jgi:hypothetical protein